jgi:hypothetical protein
MSAPPPNPPPVAYPHLGTLLVAAGTGLTSFGAADSSLPGEVKGAIAGLGVGFVSAGLFLLGRAST